MTPEGDTKKSLWNKAAWPLWLVHEFESIDKEISYYVGWVIDPGNWEEIGLLLHNGDKEEYI